MRKMCVSKIVLYAHEVNNKNLFMACNFFQAQFCCKDNIR